MIWIVTHDLQQPIPVVSKVDSYPNLGIGLEYDISGYLVRIQHKFETHHDIKEADVPRLSERQLGKFLEIIEFFYGFPPKIAQQRVKAQKPVSDSSSSIGFISISMGAYIVDQVRLPAEQTLDDDYPRLTALLHLFNAARPPASDDEAVRLYYLIWEDLHGTPSSCGSTLREQRLKFTRDFVSHGYALTRNKQAISFIESSLNQKIKAFDPTDPDHITFVTRQRLEAETLIREELKKQL